MQIDLIRISRFSFLDPGFSPTLQNLKEVGDADCERATIELDSIWLVT